MGGSVERLSQKATPCGYFGSCTVQAYWVQPFCCCTCCCGHTLHCLSGVHQLPEVIKLFR
jgi:hypothetical protein